MATSAKLPNGIVVTQGVGPIVDDERLGFVEVSFPDGRFMKRTLPLIRRDAEFSSVKFTLKAEPADDHAEAIAWLTERGYAHT